MLDFVRKAFRGGLEVVLWINLILWTVFGGIVGNFLSNRYDNYTFTGVIIGIFVGLMLNIIGGGLIATILNIDENIEQLRNKYSPKLKSAESSVENNLVQLLSGKAYTVITPTKLFYEHDSNSQVIKDLDVGDKVFYQHEAKVGQILWYFVKAFNVAGWCKAEFLKEC